MSELLFWSQKLVNLINDILMVVAGAEMNINTVV